MSGTGVVKHGLSKARFVGTALLILFTALASVPARAESEPLPDGQAASAARSGTPAGSGYLQYIAAYADREKPDREIEIGAASYSASENAALATDELDGETALLWTNAEGYVEWQFFVQESGLYSLELMYQALKGTGSAIELELLLDGERPFEEAGRLIFPRKFRDEFETPKMDKLGNDLRSKQLELQEWIRWSCRDGEGYSSGNYRFMLEEGPHTVRLCAVKEPLALQGLRFYNEDEVPSYAVYAGRQPDAAYQGECRVYEAEITQAKTSTMLYPLSDRSDPSTTPSDPLYKKLNAIGGSNWTTPDQEILWTIEVPEDGYYKLAFRYKQNFLRGLFVARTVKIDGTVPFEELEEVRFPYGVGWQTLVLGDAEPYRIYLTKGSHILSMTPTMGELASVAADVSDTVYRLNALYRKIIMITGTTPDLFRDYDLQAAVPGLLEELTACMEKLRGVEQTVYSLTGKAGSETATLGRVADQLESFIQKPNTIPSRLEALRNNIVTASSWVLSVKNQSLTLDKFYVCPEDTAFPDDSASAWQSVLYHLKAFLGSFVADYESVGQTSDGVESTISVWVSAGRDQAEVLKTLIDSEFSPSYGIGVNLSLVQGGLMQAFMAGKAPDVALMMGRGDPINYALRGAVCPLEGLNGFDDLRGEYMPTAFTPFYLDGHCYAVPETENFLMLFYRTDVLEELGLTAPETWDDMLVAAETLQRNNMNIGLPYASLDAYSAVSQGIGSQTIFPTLLLQNGNGLYTPDLTATALDSALALEAFKTWCDYYTQYDFPLYKDDFNRFRTGEMPLVIANYTFYNQLSTAAPEIRNLWQMAGVPGTREEDGSVNRLTASSGTASMILSTTADLDTSWQFVKWWNTGETQGRYGAEIENILGAAGRYNPANTSAIAYLPWSGEELKTITSQWSNVVDIPEIAGGYYVYRNIDNAFKAVIYDHENYREALGYWNRQINREITRKRAEFGLGD